MMKTCTKCGKEKDTGEFYINCGNVDNHESACKDCYKKRSTKNRAQRKDTNAPYLHPKSDKIPLQVGKYRI